jgi:cytochrome c
MPIDAPGSLTPEQVYSVVAVILAENGIVERTAVIDATTLPQVKMPARDRFVRDDRAGKTVR